MTLLELLIQTGPTPMPILRSEHFLWGKLLGSNSAGFSMDDHRMKSESRCSATPVLVSGNVWGCLKSISTSSLPARQRISHRLIISLHPCRGLDTSPLQPSAHI